MSAGLLLFFHIFIPEVTKFGLLRRLIMLTKLVISVRTAFMLQCIIIEVPVVVDVAVKHNNGYHNLCIFGSLLHELIVS